MGVNYQAVLWNRQKRIYDATLAVGLLLYIAVFAVVTKFLNSNITAETLLIRAAGTAAIVLLHVILSIGPLARLDRRFLPLLYNRRHLGVVMFTLALVHGVLSLIQFHAAGNLNPLVSLFVSNTRWDSIAQFPFQPLGFLALVILFLMASTSHDFWLHNLTAPVWKALHMLVYVAYALIVMHVALGVLQAETSPLLAGLLVIGVVWVLGLQVASAWRERAADSATGVSESAGAGSGVAGAGAVPGAAGAAGAATPAAAELDGFVRVCNVDAIEEDRAHVACLSGERVAVFRYDGKISVVSNVCQHQNGPLGEGRIIDGCITCPWHGYQYLPDSGSSPPPFTETIPTFRARVADGAVWVDPRPLAPGTPVEPATIGESS